MNEKDVLDMAGAIHDYWPGTRAIPDPLHDLSTRDKRRIAVWVQRLEPFPPELVRRKVDWLADHLDRFPAWSRLRDELGIPPQHRAEVRNCNVCHGLTVASVILEERGGAFPESVYTATAPCICQRHPAAGKLARAHEQIRDRMDRATNLDIRYQVMFERDVDALRAERKEKS